jgi:hypothetical protein
MSYEIGTATNYADLLNKLNTFLTAKGTAYYPTYTGTGNGIISAWDGGVSSIAETFTLTATGATAFDVVGSITGSIGSATVGTPFVHANVVFTLTAGTTPFIAGDIFLINTASPWVSMRAVAGSEMIWKAKGNDDTREIYVGVYCFSDGGGDYYNWRLQGFTAYTPGNTFFNQPGCIGVLSVPSPVLPLWNGSIPYWFVANGQRVIIVAKISSVYEHAYLGLINPYIAPGTWPLPLFIGGGLAYSSEPAVGSVLWKYSNNTVNAGAYWCGSMVGGVVANACPGRLRRVDGVWMGFNYFTNYLVGSNYPGQMWPYSTIVNPVLVLRENLDGTYPLLPIILSSDDGVVAGNDVNVWGELDGVKATSGYVQSSENTITEGFITQVVFQNIFRVTNDSFCVVALD